MWPSTISELLLTWEVSFTGELNHMGWLVLLLLVKFNLEIDFTLLNIHDKQSMVGVENTVLRYGGQG